MAAVWTLAVLWAGAGWAAREWAGPDWWAGVFPADALAWPGRHAVGNALRSAGSVAFAGLFLYMCDAAGLTVLGRWFGIRPVGALRCAAPLLAYLGLGTGLLGLAATGLWRPAPLWGGILVMIALGWPSRGTVRARWRGALTALWSGLSVGGRIAGGALALWLVLLLAPPEITFDPLSYDLAFPQQMLVTGRLCSTDVWSHWVIPLPAEFPYVYPLLAGVDSAARMIAAGLGVFGVLAGWRALAPEASARSSAVAALVALTLPVARSGLMTSKSDAFAIAFAAAAAGVLLEAGAFGSRGLRAARYVAGALLLGAVVAVKYLTVPLAAALGLAAVVRRAHRDRPLAAGVIAAAGVAPILPWLWRAWLGTGDPLPPIGWAVFPALAPDPEAADRTRRLFVAYVRDMRAPVAVPFEAISMGWTNAWPLVAILPWLRRAPAPVLVLLIATLAGYTGLVAGIRGAIEHVERFCHPAFTLVLLIACSRLGQAPRAVIRAARLPVAIAVALAVMALGRFEWWPGGSLQRMHVRYHLGLASAEGMRHDGMLAYGAILPRLRDASRARPGRTVLAIGEFQFWDIPARVRTTVFEPPFAWRAARGAATPARVAVAVRQANIGIVMHNQYLADWARHIDAPYGWNGRMLRVWMDWARRYLAPAGWAGRIDPNYGGAWLYAVRSAPGPAPARMPFLPGIEPALAYASLAAANGQHATAAGRFAALARRLPELGSLDALQGGALVRLGRAAEAYRLLAAADAVGVITEWSLPDLAVAAARTGRVAIAREVLRRAGAILPLWPDRLADTRRRMAVSAD